MLDIATDFPGSVQGYKGDVMTVNEMPNTPYPIAVAYGYRYTFELVKSLYILVVWRVRE